MGAILATIGGVLAIAGAATRAAGSVISNEQKIKELEDARNQLTKVYNETRQHYQERTSEENARITTQINQTAAMQETAAKQAASSIAMQDQLIQSQIAELQIEASKQEGSAIQAAAVSGFRGDMGGSLGAGVREASRASSGALKRAMIQARGQRMQSYFSALNNYTSAEYQKERYRQEQVYNENELQRQLESLKTEYDYNDAQTWKEYDYRTGWGRVWSYLGVGLDFGVDSIKAAKDAGWIND